MPPIRAADVGRRATVEGYGKGTVRFVGPNEKGSPKVGVELDNPDGKNNGKIKGQFYFKCKAKHGVLIAPEKVTLEPKKKKKKSTEAESKSPPAAGGKSSSKKKKGPEGGGSAKKEKSTSQKSTGNKASKKVKKTKVANPVSFDMPVEHKVNPLFGMEEEVGGFGSDDDFSDFDDDFGMADEEATADPPKKVEVQEEEEEVVGGFEQTGFGDFADVDSDDEAVLDSVPAPPPTPNQKSTAATIKKPGKKKTPGAGEKEMSLSPKKESAAPKKKKKDRADETPKSTKKMQAPGEKKAGGASKSTPAKPKKDGSGAPSDPEKKNDSVTTKKVKTSESGKEKKSATATATKKEKGSAKGIRTPALAKANAETEPSKKKSGTKKSKSTVSAKPEVSAADKKKAAEKKKAAAAAKKGASKPGKSKRDADPTDSKGQENPVDRFEREQREAAESKRLKEEEKKLKEDKRIKKEEKKAREKKKAEEEAERLVKEEEKRVAAEEAAAAEKVAQAAADAEEVRKNIEGARERARQKKETLEETRAAEKLARDKEEAAERAKFELSERDKDAAAEAKRVSFTDELINAAIATKPTRVASAPSVDGEALDKKAQKARRDSMKAENRKHFADQVKSEMSNFEKIGTFNDKARAEKVARSIKFDETIIARRVERKKEKEQQEEEDLLTIKKFEKLAKSLRKEQRAEQRQKKAEEEEAAIAKAAKEEEEAAILDAYNEHETWCLRVEKASQSINDTLTSLSETVVGGVGEDGEVNPEGDLDTCSGLCVRLGFAKEDIADQTEQLASIKEAGAKIDSQFAVTLRQFEDDIAENLKSAAEDLAELAPLWEEKRKYNTALVEFRQASEEYKLLLESINTRFEEPLDLAESRLPDITATVKAKGMFGRSKTKRVKGQDEIAYQVLMKKTLALGQLDAVNADLTEELPKLAWAVQAMKNDSDVDECKWSFKKDVAKKHAVKQHDKYVKNKTSEIAKCYEKLNQREAYVYSKVDKKLASQVKKKHKASEKIEKKKEKPRNSANKFLIKLRSQSSSVVTWAGRLCEKARLSDGAATGDETTLDVLAGYYYEYVQKSTSVYKGSDSLHTLRDKVYKFQPKKGGDWFVKEFKPRVTKALTDVDAAFEKVESVIEQIVFADQIERRVLEHDEKSEEMIKWFQLQMSEIEKLPHSRSTLQTKQEIDALQYLLREAQGRVYGKPGRFPRAVYQGDRIAKLFARIDVDGSGEVDFEELSNVRLFSSMKKEALKTLFDTIDVDKGGTVDIDEFRAFCAQTGLFGADIGYANANKDPILNQFQELDLDSDGKVTFEELKQGDHFAFANEDQLLKLFKSIDVNDSGGLDLDEFRLFFSGTRAKDAVTTEITEDEVEAIDQLKAENNLRIPTDSVVALKAKYHEALMASSTIHTTLTKGDLANLVSKLMCEDRDVEFHEIEFNLAGPESAENANNEVVDVAAETDASTATATVADAGGVEHEGPAATETVDGADGIGGEAAAGNDSGNDSDDSDDSDDSSADSLDGFDGISMSSSGSVKPTASEAEKRLDGDTEPKEDAAEAPPAVDEPPAEKGSWDDPIGKFVKLVEGADETYRIKHGEAYEVKTGRDSEGDVWLYHYESDGTKDDTYIASAVLEFTVNKPSFLQKTEAFQIGKWVKLTPGADESYRIKHGNAYEIKTSVDSAGDIWLYYYDNAGERGDTYISMSSLQIASKPADSGKPSAPEGKETLLTNVETIHETVSAYLRQQSEEEFDFPSMVKIYKWKEFRLEGDDDDDYVDDEGDGEDLGKQLLERQQKELEALEKKLADLRESEDTYSEDYRPYSEPDLSRHYFGGSSTSVYHKTAKKDLEYFETAEIELYDVVECLRLGNEAVKYRNGQRKAVYEVGIVVGTPPDTFDDAKGDLSSLSSSLHKNVYAVRFSSSNELEEFVPKHRIRKFRIEAMSLSDLGTMGGLHGGIIGPSAKLDGAKAQMMVDKFKKDFGQMMTSPAVFIRRPPETSVSGKKSGAFPRWVDNGRLLTFQADTKYFKYGTKANRKLERDFTPSYVPIVPLGAFLAVAEYKDKHANWKFSAPMRCKNLNIRVDEELQNFEAEINIRLIAYKTQLEEFSAEESQFGKTIANVWAETSTAAKARLQFSTKGAKSLPIVTADPKFSNGSSNGPMPLQSVSHINGLSIAYDVVLKMDDLKAQLNNPKKSLLSTPRDDSTVVLDGPEYHLWTVHRHTTQKLELDVGFAPATEGKKKKAVTGLAGVQVFVHNGFVRVSNVVPGGPASKLNLGVYDIISGVDMYDLPDDLWWDGIAVAGGKKPAALQKEFMEKQGAFNITVHSNRFELLVSPKEKIVKLSKSELRKLREEKEAKAAQLDDDSEGESSDDEADEDTDAIREDQKRIMTLGFTVSSTKQRCVVVETVDSEGGAYDAGLQVGDCLTHIDGWPLRGSSDIEIQPLLLSANSLTLSVSRPTGEHPYGTSNSVRPLAAQKDGSIRSLRLDIRRTVNLAEIERLGNGVPKKYEGWSTAAVEGGADYNAAFQEAFSGNRETTPLLDALQDKDLKSRKVDLKKGSLERSHGYYQRFD